MPVVKGYARKSKATRCAGGYLLCIPNVPMEKRAKTAFFDVLGTRLAHEIIVGTRRELALWKMCGLELKWSNKSNKFTIDFKYRKMTK